ncbi:'Cold-shock' DNA-binding domain-containing protein [Olivibacter domesticus]|uniref:'Cold-shock' DNA-binding domain-containing protein n=2 Tax=Olivibacter domesticus TaxID=407022 RepID=A0A1H7LRE7_OLID1|nr:'Cold-shock' DNA-binding domain-containing protein [Olivibacter domesticus]
MFIGAVKWFDNQKGFGMLVLPTEETLFLHVRGFASTPSTVQIGDVVIGEKKPDKKKDGFVGHNCHLASNLNDWLITMSLIDQPHTVNLNPEVKKFNSKREAPRSNLHHNLLQLAAKQILKDKDIEEIFRTAIHYHEHHLPPSQFIAYATLLNHTIKDLLDPEAAEQLLDRIFKSFGASLNPEMLFKVWKNRAFRFIGYLGDGDFEIPEEVLGLYATEIGHRELSRIKSYSFGPAFCADMVEANLDGLDFKNQEEMQEALSYVEILDGEEKIRWENYIKSNLEK